MLIRALMPLLNLSITPMVITTMSSLKTRGVIRLHRYATILYVNPKYTPYQVSFVNRYGVADFITFFKVSTEQGNFTNEQYKRSIYQDGFTTPSLQVGQYQDFNVNSRNSITMNTGWVDENYDDVIEDIL
jgi:hypothetical protein